FGSRLVNKAIYDALSAVPAVTAVVGTNIVAGLAYPPGTTLPAILYYMEQAAYGGPGGPTPAAHINSEEMRYTVRVDDEGMSDTRIAAVAQAQLDALAGEVIDLPTGEQLAFQALGEAPLNKYVDGDTFYQRLGTIYSVTIT